MKLPNLSKTYTKNVLQMREDYAAAKYECLKLLETKYQIGLADEKTLKKLAQNLRILDKHPEAGSQYWICSTQLRDHLSESTMETFKLMNDPIMQAIFWDERVPDDSKHCVLPPSFY